MPKNEDLQLGENGDSRGTSDYQLAQRASGGDMAAFEQIYLSHGALVYSISRKMTGSSLEAQDLTHDVFVHIFSRLDSFHGDASLSTWLYRTTVNYILSRLRKHRTGSGPAEMGLEALQVSSSEAPGGSTSMLERIALRDAVAQLPDRYREVFLMFDVFGFEHTEIARATGCPVGTTKTRLHKARAKLRSILA